MDSTELQFDWNLMRSFLAVMDHGSLQAAARALGHSQPTMGRHVEQLESQLSVALFERTGRALMPTETARQIAITARNMQGSADNICRLVQKKDKTLKGLVRISASRVVTSLLLPSITLKIQSVAPDIDLAVVATDSVSNLLKRDADIAIRMVKPDQADVIAKRIGEINIRPCASRSYLDRWGTPKTPPELFSHRIVGPDKDSGVLKGMAQIIQHLGLDFENIRLVYRSDDFLAQRAAIRAGVGIGFAPLFHLDDDSDLIPIPIDIPIPPLPLWLAVHREIRTTPRIRTVFNEIETYLSTVS